MFTTLKDIKLNLPIENFSFKTWRIAQSYDGPFNKLAENTAQYLTDIGIFIPRPQLFTDPVCPHTPGSDEYKEAINKHYALIKIALLLAFLKQLQFGDIAEEITLSIKEDDDSDKINSTISKYVNKTPMVAELMSLITALRKLALSSNRFQDAIGLDSSLMHQVKLFSEEVSMHLSGFERLKNKMIKNDTYSKVLLSQLQHCLNVKLILTRGYNWAGIFRRISVDEFNTSQRVVLLKSAGHSPTGIYGSSRSNLDKHFHDKVCQALIDHLKGNPGLFTVPSISPEMTLDRFESLSIDEQLKVKLNNFQSKPDLIKAVVQDIVDKGLYSDA